MQETLIMIYPSLNKSYMGSVSLQSPKKKRKRVLAGRKEVWCLKCSTQSDGFLKVPCGEQILNLRRQGRIGNIEVRTDMTEEEIKAQVIRSFARVFPKEYFKFHLLQVSFDIVQCQFCSHNSEILRYGKSKGT